jgi:hypothetical protein
MVGQKDKDRESSEFFIVEHIEKSKRAVSDLTRDKISDALTKDQSSIIEGFKKVHGDRYDYSKVDYQGAKTKITIICPDHGEFLTSPGSHQRGNGCPKCAGNYRYTIGYTTEEMVEEFKKVHGDRYDYSKVDYQGSHTKVTIICPDHGEVLTSPNSHLHGKDCPKCTGNYRYSTEEMVEEFKKVHGDRYDYSKVKYVNGGTKVTIICPDHGEFYLVPKSHLQKKRGCPTCTPYKYTRSQDEVIREFKRIHGDRYDYSKVKYVNGGIKVTIICKEHGEFLQTPKRHRKRGCPDCGMERVRASNLGRKASSSTRLKQSIAKRGKPPPNKLTTERVIKDFRRVHGDRYDYSKVEYETGEKKVTIICPDHGEFQQSPRSHKSGAGCRKCYDQRRQKTAKK